MFVDDGILASSSPPLLEKAGSGKNMNEPHSRRLQILLLTLGALLVVFPLLVNYGTWENCFDEVFTWVPRHSPQPMEALFAILMMPFLILHGLSFLIGTAIVTLLAWLASKRWVCVHPSVLEPLLLPVLSAVWLVIQVLPFLKLPTGTPIRPMGWALYGGVSALALTIRSVIGTFAMFKKGKNKLVCSLALIVSLILIAVPAMSLHTVAHAKGLILEP